MFIVLSRTKMLGRLCLAYMTDVRYHVLHSLSVIAFLLFVTFLYIHDEEFAVGESLGQGYKTKRRGREFGGEALEIQPL